MASNTIRLDHVELEIMSRLALANGGWIKAGSLREELDLSYGTFYIAMAVLRDRAIIERKEERLGANGFVIITYYFRSLIG